MRSGAGKMRWLPATAAILLAVAWLAIHGPVHHHAGSDLYTHLAIARHLLQGDGFVNDVVYPLSLTFPFAADVPQSLIHRPPGYPLLMTIPVAFSGDDPAYAVVLAGYLHILLLTLLAGFGAALLQRRGRNDTILPWLATLLVSPLLAMTVGWSQVEIPVAVLLLWLWLRLRDNERIPGAGQAVGDGLLAAAVTLLRADLFWLPWLWIVWLGRNNSRRHMFMTAACWAAALLPWGLRNMLLTGSPFFTLQAYAEHLKETSLWPGYSIYTSLAPESFWRTLAHNPVLIIHKTAAGLRYYLTRLDGWLPPPLWIAGAAALATRWRCNGRAGHPLTVLGISLALLTLAYAPLSHTLRYMAVIMPLLALESWSAAATWLSEHTTGKRGPWIRAITLTLLTVLCLWITPARMPG